MNRPARWLLLPLALLLLASPARADDLLGKKAPSKPWQLRVTKGHLMLDIAEDIYPLVKFGKDGDRLSTTPVLKWAAKGGLTTKEVEDLVNAGLADARNS